MATLPSNITYRDELAGKLIQPGSNAGRSVVIRPNPLSATSPASLAIVPSKAGDPIGEATLLDLSGDDEKSEVMSVTLANRNLRVPAGPPVNALARPSALILWGVCGVQAQVEVDFEHGFSFCIPCSYIRVVGRNDMIPHLVGTPPAFPKFGRNVELGAFCSYGSVSRANAFNGKRTIYLDTIAGPMTTRIPDFSTNFIVYTTLDTAPFTVLILDESGGVTSQVTFPIGNANAHPFELTGDAAFLQFLFPPAVLLARVIFGLSI